MVEVEICVVEVLEVVELDVVEDVDELDVLEVVELDVLDVVELDVLEEVVVRREILVDFNYPFQLPHFPSHEFSPISAYEKSHM